jgi:tRNA(Ile)-lysidine synthase
MRTTRPLAPGSAVALWRPLLGERRAALRAALRAAGIPWSEDATNEDRRFARNRARLEALPALARVLGADPAPLLARLAAGADALDRAGTRLLAPPPDGWGDAAALRATPRGLRRAALAGAYAAAGGDPGLFTRRHLARALRVVAGRAAAASLPRGFELRRRGGRIRVRRRTG